MARKPTPTLADKVVLGDLDGEVPKTIAGKLSGGGILNARPTAGATIYLVVEAVAGDAPSFKRDDAGNLIRVETLKANAIAVLDERRLIRELELILDAANGRPARLPLDDAGEKLEELEP